MGVEQKADASRDSEHPKGATTPNPFDKFDRVNPDESPDRTPGVPAGQIINPPSAHNIFDPFDKTSQSKDGVNSEERALIEREGGLTLSDVCSKTTMGDPLQGTPLLVHAISATTVGASLALLAALVAMRFSLPVVAHGIGLVTGLVVCALHVYLYPEAAAASALASVALSNALLWSYKVHTKAPVNGWTRIYAVAVGLPFVVGAASRDYETMLGAAGFVGFLSIARFLFLWIIRGFKAGRIASGGS